MNEIYIKLEEYKSLLNFDDEYFSKDFKSNLKFIKYAINKMLKQNIDFSEIIKFIEDTITIHKQNYLNINKISL